ncbi:MAG: GNAT family N-acetyltransferase, partial [bacterium]
MLKINEITSFDEFIKLQVEWNELLSQCENDSVFLSHEWFKVWWKHFGENKQLFILLVREEETLVGIAPLMRVTEKIGNIRLFPSRQIRFIENCEAPHVDFIIKKNRLDVLQFIFNYLESVRNQWDIIILENVPNNSFILKYKLKNKYRSLLKFQIQQTRMNPVLQTNSDWESYYLTRSKRFRGAIRNRRNKIQKFGEITIDKITNPQCIGSAL